MASSGAGTSAGPTTAAPGAGRRARWGTISRRQIVDAALEAVRGEDFDRLTIRSLAARLGVAPMSLYHYIHSKDELLDEVVDELLRRAWVPPAGAGDWREWIAQAADGLRQLLVEEPAALHLYLRHPVVTPAAITRMDAMIQVLREAGFDDQSAPRVYAAIHTYTVGFAALEASRSAWVAPGGPPDAIAARLAVYTTPSQFARGLEYLLEGAEGRRRGATSLPDPRTSSGSD